MKQLALLLLFSLFSFASVVAGFSDLTQPMQRWDEETNITVVRETHVANSFPFLVYQNRPFFEKPPLWYWINIVIGSLAGMTPYTLRMISACAGIGILYITAFIAWRLWGATAAFIAWGTLLLTPHLYMREHPSFFSTHSFRSADLDALFIFFFLLSFLFVLLPNKKRMFPYVGFFSGLAVMTKGPLGILPLCFYLFTLNSRPKYRDTARMYNILVAIVVVVPWYVVMSLMYGRAFFFSHIFYHVGTRIITPIEGHSQPILYYFFLLANPSFFPAFSVLAIATLYILVHRKLLRDIPFIAVCCMAAVLFIIPSIAQTKLAWYILPAYPFFALIISRVVAHVVINRPKQ